MFEGPGCGCCTGSKGTPSTPGLALVTGVVNTCSGVLCSGTALFITGSGFGNPPISLIICVCEIVVTLHKFPKSSL